jgi:ribosomal protein S12 methylthiotransferase
METQSKISYAFNASRVGTVTRVLADSYSDGVLVCRSEFESPEVDGEILVRGPEKLVGTFFDVKITGADEYDLVAELVQ